jgi:beta-lactamase regulating signal transducer with metallopeptidase domain
MMPMDLLTAVESGTSAVWIGSLLAKGTLVLLATAAAARLAGRRSAAVRHLIWGLGLVGCLGLAASALALPSWSVSGVALPALLGPAGHALGVTAVFGEGSAGAIAAVPSSPGAISWAALAFLGWAIGAAVLLAALGRDLWRAHRLVSGARPILEGDLFDAVANLAQARGVRPPALRASKDIEGPFTTGILRPTIVVPPSADRWSPADQRAVFSHELAHIQRRDCLTQLLAQVARALHWPNPLAWFAERRLRAEREMAADDAALTAGSRASEYADFLLGLAATLGREATAPTAALTMAGQSPLGERLERLLDPRRRRRPVEGRRAACALLGALALAVPLGCLAGGEAPAPQTPARTAAAGMWVAVADHDGPGVRAVATAGATARAQALGLVVANEQWKPADGVTRSVPYLAGPSAALRQYLAGGAVKVDAPERLLVEELEGGRARTHVVNTAAMLDIVHAELTVDREDPQWPTVWVNLSSEGGQRMYALTAAHVGDRMAVMVGDRVLSVPYVRSAFGPRFQLTVGKSPGADRAIAELTAAVARASEH